MLRTSIIAGLPGEGEEEFDELCDFLREQKLLRAGVFPYSPEEGTRAAKMERVDSDEAARRAERIVDIQSEIIDAWNDERQGDVMEVLCEGFDGQSMLFVGRSYAESPGHRRAHLLHRPARRRGRASSCPCASPARWTAS